MFNNPHMVHSEISAWVKLEGLRCKERKGVLSMDEISEQDMSAIAWKTLDTIAERLAGIVKTCLHKEPNELTKDERFAIAVYSGVDYEFTMTGMVIKQPFEIAKRDGRFLVYTRASKDGLNRLDEK